MIYRLVSRPLLKTSLAVGTAAYAVHSLHRPVRLDGTFDKIKDAASDLKEKAKAAAPTSPLKPQSPAGIAGARTSHNPSTSMNHGQTAGESDADQADPLVSAQKKRQKSSSNTTDNDATQGTAKQGGGTGAKIASGHSKDADGKREPNHDGIKSSNQPKKEPKTAPSTGGKPASPTGKEARSGDGAAGAGLTGAVAAGMGEKEKEASKEEAFNEETGEINWDCPCLGGMAHGPCGEDFKAAFSCFVYSKEEPKGSECLDKFKAMQSCFREHPEIYGNLTDDDETPEGKVVQ